MYRVRESALLIVCLLFLASLATAQSPPAPDYVANQVIVKLRTGIQASDAAAIRGDLKPITVKQFSLVGAELWELSGDSVEDVIEKYKNDPRFEYIEPNYIVRANDLYPDDPLFDQLWGLHNTGQSGGTPDADIDAPAAWHIITGTDVLVGVIDTGVDWLHGDLAANIWTNLGEIPDNGVDDDGNGYIDDVRGWDFYNNDNNPMDDNGHGTHVSGTIAAVGDNSLGVTGICWSAKIMPLKFLSGSGSGTTTAAIEALEYATMMGAKLTNNSWGGGGYSSALREAIESARDAGALFVAAAGNDGWNNETYHHYPSDYDLENVVSVAATDHNDELASFSNYGAVSVDLGAPGVNIYSLRPNDAYGFEDGTSMASPHVAGVAALYWSKYPSATYADVKGRILNSVDTTTSLQGITVTGGRLNAFNTLAVPDSIPPAALTDLAALNPTSGSLELSWTATGDDGQTGQAAVYDMRYSISQIDSANFDAATPVVGLPYPQQAGVPESFTLTGLGFNTTYYVAIKVVDELGNTSSLSNVASGTTLGQPAVSLSPDRLYETLITGGYVTTQVSVSNAGEGTLDFSISLGEESVVPALSAARTYTLTPPQSAAASPEGESVSVPTEKIRTAPLTASLADLTGVTVLFDRSHGQVSSLYWSTIMNDLAVRGATIMVNEEEITPGLLSGVGVVWITDTSAPWSAGERTALSDWLTAGGGLLIEGDDSSSDFNAILETLDAGIDFAAAAGTSGETTNIHPHAMTNGVGSAYIADNHSFLFVSEETAGRLIDDRGGVPNAAYCRAGRGRIVVMAEELSMNSLIGVADNQLFVNNVYDWLALGGGWLTFAPESGTVFASDSALIAVNFDAATLGSGLYSADLVVTTNDPLTPEATVHTQLQVTGARDIAVADSLIDFGTGYVGFIASDTLIVSNHGSGNLSISGLSVDNPDFQTDGGAFLLAPGESRRQAVLFAPAATGLSEGTLTVSSDDPDEPVVTVSLRGLGASAPAIEVVPVALTENLPTGGTTTHLVTVLNTGGSQLDWNAVVYRGAGGASARQYTLTTPATIDPGPAGELLEPPSGRKRNTPVTAVLADLSGVNILYDRAHGQESIESWSAVVSDLTERGATVTVNVDTLTSVLLEGYDVYWTVDANAYWLWDEKLALTEWISEGGGLLVTVDAFDYYTRSLMWSVDAGIEFLDERGQSGSTTNLFPHQTTRRLENIYIHKAQSTIGVSGPVAKPLANDAAGLCVAAYSALGSGRFVAISEEMFRDGLIGYDDNQLFANQVFQWLALGVNWLSVNPGAGALAAGDSATIDVLFDATSLVGGAYEATLQFESNDPALAEPIVSVQLNVTGAPDIEVSATTVDFGFVFIGALAIDALVVTNDGVDSLVVSGVSTDNPVFQVAGGSFVVAVGEEKEILVDFSPASTGIAQGILTITSDDPDEGSVDVDVVGVGIEPPQITVSPDSLEEWLAIGDSASRILTIENNGDSELTFNIVEGVPGFTVTGASAAEARRKIENESLNQSVHVDGERIAFNAGQPPLREKFQSEQSSSYVVSPLSKRILILQSNGDVSEIRGLLLDYPQFAVVDVWDAYYPWNDLTLEFLMGYHCVIVANNYTFGDPNGVGDVLADYVDSGGNVVLTVASFEDYWAVKGRFWDEGYMPMKGNGDYLETASLGSFEGSHPIMRGVSAVAGDVLAGGVALEPGAVWVADWEGDVPFVATMGGSVAAVNIFVAESAYWTGDVPLILRNAVLWTISENICWVSPEYTTGIIAPHSSIDLTITFDAGAECLIDGDYVDTLVVESTDPANPVWYVPIALHAVGQPDIAVADTALDYGPVVVGETRLDTLIISNIGSDTLVVSQIVLSHAAYFADTTGFWLAVGDSVSLTVGFTPDGAGPINGTLSILSNDPDEPVVDVLLTGEGRTSAAAAVYPAALSANLAAGASTSEVVTIRNDGGVDLDWSVRVGDRVDLDDIDILYDDRHAYTGGYSKNWTILADDLISRGATIAEINAVITPEIFVGYDVLWTTDLRTPWWGNEISAAGDWVKAGGTLLLSGDYRVEDFNDILDELGVNIQCFYGYDPTDTTSNIFPHETTRGVSEIQLTGNYIGRLVVSGPATVLIRDNEDDAVAASCPVERGRVIVLADEMFTDYHIDAVDNRLFAGQVFEWLATGANWLSVDSISGTIPPGDSVSINATFDTAFLYDGSYQTNLIFDTSDPTRPQILVPADLSVSGDPDIDLSTTSLDFGSAVLGATKRLVVEVSNAGWDTLAVTNVSSTDASFVVTEPPFSLGEESRAIIVDFNPQEIGPISGTLIVESNDPDESIVNVTLQGIGLESPMIAVNPDWLNASLSTGETTDRTLFVKNDGPTDLEWSIYFDYPDTSVLPPADLSGVRVMFDQSHGQISRSYLSIMSADITDRGVTIVDNSEPITGGLLSSYDVVWTSHSPNAWTTDEILALCEWFNNGGGLLVHGTSSEVFNVILDLMDAGIEYAPSWTYGAPGTTNNIYPHRTTVGVSSVSLANVYTHLAEVDFPAFRLVDDADDVPNIAATGSGRSRLVAAVSSMTYDIAMDDDDNRLFANQVFDWLSGRVSWLTVNPAFGTIAPGDSASVLVSFNAANLPGGGYDADLVVVSNDWTTGEVSVHAHLDVTGTADIAVSDSLLEFGSIYVGSGLMDTLVVYNEGVAPLVVTGVSIDDPSFSADTTGIVVDAGDSTMLVVTFAPLSAGPATGTMTLVCNDPDEGITNVALSGTGLYPPVLSVRPSSLSDELNPGEVSMHSVVITNTGTGELQWNARSTNLPEHSHDLDGVHILYDKGHGSPNSPGILKADLISRGATFVESQHPITLERLAGYHVVWLRGPRDSLTIGEKTALVAWVSAGGGLLLSGGANAVDNCNAILSTLGAGIDISSSGGPYSSTTTNICPHEITEDVGTVFLFPYYRWLSRIDAPAGCLVLDTDSRPNSAYRGIGPGRVVAIAGDGMFDDYRINIEDNRVLGNQVFDWLALAVNWITVDPRSGTISPGDSAVVTVTLTATDLYPGVFDAGIAVESNDPVTPAVGIPVQLRVLGQDVTPPSVAVLSPNGGESYTEGELVDVRWLALDNTSVDSVSVYLSSDGGAHFDLVTSGEPNDSLYQWTVPPVGSDSCLIKVVAYDAGLLTGEDASNGFFSITTITGAGDDRSVVYTNRLEQNCPNPFNPSTTIRYSIKERGRVTLKIYTVTGELVKTLVDEDQGPTAGGYGITWNGRNSLGVPVSSGVYFCALRAKNFTQTRKMILLK